MKYFEFKVNDGQINMQIDSDLLEFAIHNQQKEPTLRLYAWAPACVSLGRNQKDCFLDYDYLKSQNIDVVRRLTGGRALLHDNELTYSYICPVSCLQNGESIVNSYKEISQFLIKSFDKLGIKLDFGGSQKKHTKSVNGKIDYCMSIATGADLCHNGKKLIGSAQFRKEGYILQHGSILIDYNADLLEKLFNEKFDKNSITCINTINPNLKLEDITTSIIDSFQQ